MFAFAAKQAAPVAKQRARVINSVLDFMAQMKEKHNIGVGFHYAPIHLFKLYRDRGFKEGMFPVAERVGKQIVSLPMFYAMNESDVERTCAAMREVLA